MATFLTTDWFNNVDTLTQEIGELNAPPALATLNLNMFVSDAPEGDVEMSYQGGKICKGFSDDAQTKLSLDAQTLKAAFLEFDMNAAMQAFMTGQIKVEGDMSQLMALQTSKPSTEQKTLFKNILAMTEKA